ncbi:MAG: hypothetical protein AABZ60_08500 [Planctomycetota bacterium]
MIVGHFATALIPASRYPRFPVLLFLIASNLADFLWLFLALFRIEPPNLLSMWEVTFQRMKVPIMYSHETWAILLMAGVVAGITYLWFRQKGPALWCGLLVVLHLLEDWLSGLEHSVWGPGTPCLSLNLYGKAPHLAIVIEAVFGAGCVFYYEWSESKQGRPIPPKKLFCLYSIFTLGALIWLPTATVSLGEWRTLFFS